MLLLRCRPGRAVAIGSDVEVTVDGLSLNGARVTVRCRRGTAVRLVVDGGAPAQAGGRAGTQASLPATSAPRGGRERSDSVVLFCAPGSSILVGDAIEVRLLATVGRSAEIGVTAPRQLRVLRSELLSRRDLHGPYRPPEAEAEARAPRGGGPRPREGLCAVQR